MAFWDSWVVRALLGVAGLLVSLYPWARMVQEYQYQKRVLAFLSSIEARLGASREREDDEAADEEDDDSAEDGVVQGSHDA